MKGAHIPLCVAALALAMAASASAAPVPSGGAVQASAATESCHTFVGTDGASPAATIQSLSGYIAAAGYVMVFDANSAPVDGAVTPKYVFYAAAAGSWSAAWGAAPAQFAAGVTVCTSSTGPLTKTAVAGSTFAGIVQ